MGEFVEGVFSTIKRYDIDILGVTETGLPGEDFDGVREALLGQLRRKLTKCSII